MRVLFVVGAPGVGKTTFVREALLTQDAYLVQSPKWTVSEATRVVAAGHYLGATFDGADTVPYNGVKPALQFWKERFLPDDAFDLTVFDGDRFSNRPAVDTLKACGVKLLCMHLTAPDTVADARRAERGSQQNSTWIKGRVTKARNFAALDVFDRTLELDASPPVEALARQLEEFLQ